MIASPCKKNKTLQPPVALLSQASWINQQLDQVNWRSVSSTARKIIADCSPEEIRGLPEETRQRLLRHLSTGRITEADRRAVNKLQSAQLAEIEYQQHMIIKGPPEFVNKTKAHLQRLAELKIGQDLLCSLKQSGRQVTIIPTHKVSEAPPNNFKAAIPKGSVIKWQTLGGKEKVMRGTGQGSNTIIKYNPGLTCSGRTADWRKHPPEIALAHELIHADDAAHGRLDPDEVSGVRNYERQAVGLPPYEEKRFTENNFRKCWRPQLPPRTRY